MNAGISDTACLARKIYFLMVSKVLGLFIPTNQNKWIFGSEMGHSYSSNSKYLFNFIRQEKKDIRAIWISKRRSVARKILEEGGEACFNFSHKGVFHCVSAGTYFCSTDPSDIMLVRVRTCRIINLWHSVTIKKVVYDRWPERVEISSWRRALRSLMGRPTFEDVDLHIATSESQIKVLSSAFNSSKFAICGQPREDVLFTGDVSVIAQRIKLYLEIGNKKLVLYMPTHRDYGNGRICPTIFRDNAEAKEILERHNAVAFTKNHINMQKKVRPYIDRRGTVREITLLPIDTQELLCAADVLITDYSSCYVEYLHLNRPVIFYHYDNYTTEDNAVYFREKDIMPGPIVRNEEELLNAIIAALGTPFLYSATRKKVRDFFYKHQDGNSSDRVYRQVACQEGTLLPGVKPA